MFISIQTDLCEYKGNELPWSLVNAYNENYSVNSPWKYYMFHDRQITDGSEIYVIFINVSLLISCCPTYVNSRESTFNNLRNIRCRHDI